MVVILHVRKLLGRITIDVVYSCNFPVVLGNNYFYPFKRGGGMRGAVVVREPGMALIHEHTYYNS